MSIWPPFSGICRTIGSLSCTKHRWRHQSGGKTIRPCAAQQSAAARREAFAYAIRGVVASTPALPRSAQILPPWGVIWATEVHFRHSTFFGTFGGRHNNHGGDAARRGPYRNRIPGPPLCTYTSPSGGIACVTMGHQVSRFVWRGGYIRENDIWAP